MKIKNTSNSNINIDKLIYVDKLEGYTLPE